jgi:hypothetical protein
MDKNTLDEIINDLRGRRDCLALAHSNLKKESDKYNKVIITLSLITGSFESTKMTLGWENPYVQLVPIFMSSIIGIISALTKFRDFSTKMEVLIQAQGTLTTCLTKARNSKELTPDLLHEYNISLEQLETSLYPDLRKKYLKASHKNLLSILKHESEYFNNIKKVNAGEDINIKCDSSSDDIISIKHVDSFTELELGNVSGEKIEENKDKPVEEGKLNTIIEE